MNKIIKKISATFLLILMLFSVAFNVLNYDYKVYANIAPGNYEIKYGKDSYSGTVPTLKRSDGATAFITIKVIFNNDEDFNRKWRINNSDFDFGSEITKNPSDKSIAFRVKLLPKSKKTYTTGEYTINIGVGTGYFINIPINIEEGNAELPAGDALVRTFNSDGILKPEVTEKYKVIAEFHNSTWKLEKVSGYPGQSLDSSAGCNKHGATMGTEGARKKVFLYNAS